MIMYPPGFTSFDIDIKPNSGLYVWCITPFDITKSIELSLKHGLNKFICKNLTLLRLLFFLKSFASFSELIDRSVP